MSRVEPQQMGLAAGVLSTAHEIGAAGIALVLAAIALLAVPCVKPAGAAQAMAH